MCKLVGVLTLLTLVALGSIVFAQKTLGDYTMYGHGVTTCGTWVAEHARKSEEAKAQSAWVMGFVSGYEYTRPGELHETNADAIAVWIGNYCQAYPQESMARAAGTLVHELRTQ